MHEPWIYVSVDIDDFYLDVDLEKQTHRDFAEAFCGLSARALRGIFPDAQVDVKVDGLSHNGGGITASDHGWLQGWTHDRVVSRVQLEMDSAHDALNDGFLKMIDLSSGSSH